MGCVHRLLDSVDVGITVIYYTMLILVHFDNTEQGAVLFKLRGFVAKMAQGQFSISGVKRHRAVVSSRIVHWRTHERFHSQKYQDRVFSDLLSSSCVLSLSSNLRSPNLHW